MLAALPAVAALGAAAILRERLGGRRWAAVGLAATGMAALAAAGRGQLTGSLAGDALVFAAVLGEASYILLARVSAGAVSPLRGTFWMQLASAGLLAPLALPALGDAGALGTPLVAALLLYHALTASLGANLLWYSGLRRGTGQPCRGVQHHAAGDRVHPGGAGAGRTGRAGAAAGPGADGRVDRAGHLAATLTSFVRSPGVPDIRLP